MGIWVGVKILAASCLCCQCVNCVNPTHGLMVVSDLPTHYQHTRTLQGGMRQVEASMKMGPCCLPLETGLAHSPLGSLAMEVRSKCMCSCPGRNARFGFSCASLQLGEQRGCCCLSRLCMHVSKQHGRNFSKFSVALFFSLSCLFFLHCSQAMMGCPPPPPSPHHTLLTNCLEAKQGPASWALGCLHWLNRWGLAMARVLLYVCGFRAVAAGQWHLSSGSRVVALIYVQMAVRPFNNSTTFSLA